MIDLAVESLAAAGWHQPVLWLTLILTGLAGSAMFSGLETGVYQLNRVRLHLLAEQGQPSARLLHRLTGRPNRLLGALLIGNNLSNYIASIGITALIQTAGTGPWTEVLISALILTPGLFIFAEILPKDFFANYTDRITYPFARPLWLWQRLLTLTGLLGVLDQVNRLLGRLVGDRRRADRLFPPRHAVAHLIKEGLGRGILSPYQSAMIDRVLYPPEQLVADVMVPWSRVHRLPADCSVEAIWRLAERVPYSRWPVVRPDGSVLGALDVFEVLRRDPAECPPPATLAHPLPAVPADRPIRQALRQLQREQYPMGLVIRQGKPVGVITFKDLVEPIVGELDVW